MKSLLIVLSLFVFSITCYSQPDKDQKFVSSLDSYDIKDIPLQLLLDITPLNSEVIYDETEYIYMRKYISYNSNKRNFIILKSVKVSNPFEILNSTSILWGVKDKNNKSKQTVIEVTFNHYDDGKVSITRSYDLNKFSEFCKSEVIRINGPNSDLEANVTSNIENSVFIEVDSTAFRNTLELQNVFYQQGSHTSRECLSFLDSLCNVLKIKKPKYNKLEVKFPILTINKYFYDCIKLNLVDTTIYELNGSVYKGNSFNGQRHGLGEYTYNDRYLQKYCSKSLGMYKFGINWGYTVRYSSSDSCKSFVLSSEMLKGSEILTGYVKIYNSLNLYQNTIYNFYNQKYYNSYTNYFYKDILFSLGGLIFDGEFKNAKPNGIGRYFSNYTGKKIFEGNIIDGKPNGKGYCYNELTGNLFCEGDFKNSILIADLIFYYDDGITKLYQGKFDYGQGGAHGFGYSYDKNGTVVYMGEWENGLAHGKMGLLFNNGKKIYHGDFENGIPHGNGMLYDNEERPVYNGKFKNGEPESKKIPVKEYKDRLNVHDDITVYIKKTRSTETKPIEDAFEDNDDNFRPPK